MAADKSVRIEVVGLAALQRAFKQTSDELPDRMAGHLMGIAEMVAGRVRSVFPGHTSTIIPRAQQRGATITLGGSHGPWLDMGGSTKRWPGSANGFQPIHREWMGKDVKSPPGRYLFPAVSEARGETRSAMEAALEEVVEAAGF